MYDCIFTAGSLFLLLFPPCMAPARLVAGFHPWQNAMHILPKSAFHAARKYLIWWLFMQWITRIQLAFSLGKSIKIGNVHMSSKTENVFFLCLVQLLNYCTMSQAIQASYINPIYRISRIILQKGKKSLFFSLFFFFFLSET